MEAGNSVMRTLNSRSLVVFDLLGFDGSSQVAQKVKNPPAMRETWVRSLGSIPGLGRSPGGGRGNPLQYSCLENPMDRRAYNPRGRKESDTTERLSTAQALMRSSPSRLPLNFPLSAH